MSRINLVQQNATTALTIDPEGIPTHCSIDTPAIKLAIDPSYVPSPQPTAGELRRICGLKVNEQIGTSSFNFKLDLDYQNVDGSYVANQAWFEMLGAYSIRMTFTDCTASKAVAGSLQVNNLFIKKACYSRKQTGNLYAQSRLTKYAARTSFKALVAVTRALHLPSPPSACAAYPHAT